MLFKDIENDSEDDKINEAIRILTIKKASYDDWQARLPKAAAAAAAAAPATLPPPAATGRPYLVSHPSHYDYILDHKDTINWPINEQNAKIGFEEVIARHGTVTNNIRTLTRIILNPSVADQLDDRDHRFKEKKRVLDGQYYIITGKEYNTPDRYQSYVYEKVEPPNICKKVGLYTGLGIGSFGMISFDKLMNP